MLFKRTVEQSHAIYALQNVILGSIMSEWLKLPLIHYKQATSRCVPPCKFLFMFHLYYTYFDKLKATVRVYLDYAPRVCWGALNCQLPGRFGIRSPHKGRNLPGRKLAR